jgi:predicted alpha-1,6-mannanase (GH76 family)
VQVRGGHVGQVGRPDDPHAQADKAAAGRRHVRNLEYRHVPAVAAAPLEVPASCGIRLRRCHYLNERVAYREHRIGQAELCYSRILKWLSPAESLTQLASYPAAVAGHHGHLAQAGCGQHILHNRRLFSGQGKPVRGVTVSWTKRSFCGVAEIRGVCMAEPGYRAYATAGITTLQRWYVPSTGLWATTGWWNAANALTAVIEYTQRTGDRRYAGVIETTFIAAQRRHADFINNYYDDNGWWALAWVAAYDLTGDERYLEAARTIFARNENGWDSSCGGGLWWSEAKKYKNAITNELFLTLAALLHQRSPDSHGSYWAWALREWEWLSSSGLIGASGLVNDGLTSACKNNGGTTWTYNQGVILGGLAALYQISGDRAYLAQGESIADAALKELAGPPSAGQPGILAEPTEHATAIRDRDRPQFKGIFVRYLYDFYLQSCRPAYSAFILANASSIWKNARNAKNEFGLHWGGPFDRADAGRQSSALDALNAAAALAAT